MARAGADQPDSRRLLARDVLVEIGDELGQRLRLAVAVAELPNLGRAPRVDEAVVREREGMGVARGDLPHALAHETPHELRRREGALLAEAELSGGSGPPRIHITRVGEGEDVPRSARDLPHALRLDLLQFGRDVDERAQLLVEVVLIRRRDRQLRLERLHLHVQVDALSEQRVVLQLQPRRVLLRLDEGGLGVLEALLRLARIERLARELHLQLLDALQQPRLRALIEEALLPSIERDGERHGVLVKAFDALNPLALQALDDGRHREVAETRTEGIGG